MVGLVPVNVKHICWGGSRSGEAVCGRGRADIKGHGALPMSAHAWRAQEPDRGLGQTEIGARAGNVFSKNLPEVEQIDGRIQGG